MNPFSLITPALDFIALVLGSAALVVLAVFIPAAVRRMLRGIK